MKTLQEQEQAQHRFAALSFRDKRYAMEVIRNHFGVNDRRINRAGVRHIIGCKDNSAVRLLLGIGHQFADAPMPVCAEPALAAKARRA